jgi:tetratricopeptide (TPR) repeat protein
MNRRDLLPIFALLVLPALAHGQNCVPPDEMKPKLVGTPSVETINDLGVWFAQHQQFDCAVQVFATSLQSDPQQRDLPHVIFEFGAALLYSGDAGAGVTAFRQAETLGYRDVNLHRILAGALDAQHATAEAIEEWKLTLAYDPDSTPELDALSTDLVAAGRFQEAADLLEQPRVRPNRSIPQFLNLAAALVQLGKAEEAVTALEDGMNTYPSSVEISQKLGAVLIGLNRNAEAAMVLKLTEQHACESGQ